MLIKQKQKSKITLNGYYKEVIKKKKDLLLLQIKFQKFYVHLFITFSHTHLIAMLNTYQIKN